MTDTTVEAPATPRLKVKYNEQIIPELEKEFKYSNPCLLYTSPSPRDTR